MPKVSHNNAKNPYLLAHSQAVDGALESATTALIEGATFPLLATDIVNTGIPGRHRKHNVRLT